MIVSRRMRSYAPPQLPCPVPLETATRDLMRFLVTYRAPRVILLTHVLVVHHHHPQRAFCVCRGSLQLPGLHSDSVALSQRSGVSFSCKCNIVANDTYYYLYRVVLHVLLYCMALRFPMQFQSTCGCIPPTSSIVRHPQPAHHRTISLGLCVLRGQLPCCRTIIVILILQYKWSLFRVGHINGMSVVWVIANSTHYYLLYEFNGHSFIHSLPSIHTIWCDVPWLVHYVFDINYNVFTVLYGHYPSAPPPPSNSHIPLSIDR